MTCCRTRGQTKGTDSSKKLLNFEKPQAKMYNYMYKSISKKFNKSFKKWEEKKSQMRAEFKLHYFKSYQVNRLLRTHTCIQLQHVRIPLHTIVSLCSPGIGMFTEPSCYTASYSLVPLSFKTHCKSLLSLERQIVTCLQRSSTAGDSFWVSECKSFDFFLTTLGQ